MYVTISKIRRFKQNDFINYDIHLSLSVQMHESYMKNIFKHQIKVQVHGIHSKLYCILEVVTYM